MMFCPLTPDSETGASVAIVGRGLSLWHDKQVEFVVKGRYDPATHAVHITKTHRGAYVNSVVYDGALDPDTKSIAGEYPLGTIQLQSLGFEQPPEDEIGRIIGELNGIWRGSSHDHRRHRTDWADTEISATKLEGQAVVSIVGRGTSAADYTALPCNST